MRYAVGIEYIGTAYSGWQALSGRQTVQGELERALGKVADHPLEVVAAGRTDAGVHALQQIAHFDSPARRSDYAWLLGTNTNLPPDISLRWVQPVAENFHARYAAVARRYRYVIHNHRARSALCRERAAWWPQQLDAQAMHEAAQCLLGENDFSAFRDSQCQSPTPMRNLHRLTVQRRGEFVVMDVIGNAFLHHMVRNIAGTLLPVGMGEQPVAWVAQVLASRDRKCAGMTAPAAGLYFVGAEYPAEFALPEPPAPWFPG
ncbi:tRNA pseudouridine38-40 synthase [Solimonas aquatica]|uniref:tRNA pseudouridine synthase A n=1 Tax=Solimonas aquatica TaxID=489703 RepID=A0A1H9A1I4_9GAMM|nr:tRNA pseudouridine(38-40) synthase TruA [Solimonas aquatica]SEP69868.1 tRNA pseudouridine38-40 synthase [Solimonas aquatica]